MINLYKNFLNEVYTNYIDNEKHLELLAGYSKLAGTQHFNHDFRTYSISLGRRLGASTAFKDFIKKHPEKNFALITSQILYKSIYEEFIKVEKLSNIKLITSLHEITGTIPSIDIILFDNSELLTGSYIHKNIEEYILSRMNSNRLDQVLIKFQ